jgi:hypothetical protein
VPCSSTTGPQAIRNREHAIAAGARLTYDLSAAQAKTADAGTHSGARERVAAKAGLCCARLAKGPLLPWVQRANSSFVQSVANCAWSLPSWPLASKDQIGFVRRVQIRRSLARAFSVGDCRPLVGPTSAISHCLAYGAATTTTLLATLVSRGCLSHCSRTHSRLSAISLAALAQSARKQKVLCSPLSPSLSPAYAFELSVGTRCFRPATQHTLQVQRHTTLSTCHVSPHLPPFGSIIGSRYRVEGEAIG